jgi:hypothetical protein
MFHETMSAKYLLLTGATGEEIPLTWLQRLKIAVQCAQGMYIHIYILIDLFVTSRCTQNELALKGIAITAAGS